MAQGLPARDRQIAHHFARTDIDALPASASMMSGKPLPPYVTVPHPIDIADQLGAIDPGILSIKHIKEPCYAAFAVLEIASILIMQEMVAALAKVRELVGEVDFSVHFMGEGDSTMSEPGNLKGVVGADGMGMGMEWGEGEE